MSRSTKPYLIRALHEWCMDSNYTPHLMVWVDEHASVPREYVKENEIVLNISHNATRDLTINDEFISFSARFGGVPRDIWIPIGNVMSIFAHETGEGMGFDVELADPASRPVAVPPVPENKELAVADTVSTEDAHPHRPTGRPSLRIVK